MGQEEEGSHATFETFRIFKRPYARLNDAESTHPVHCCVVLH